MLDGVFHAEGDPSLDQGNFGPSLPISKDLHQGKYRSLGETFPRAMHRITKALMDDQGHACTLLQILLNMKFLPAGRVQSAIGRDLMVTPYNCFVSGTVEDSFDSIMKRLVEAGTTMRLGGGIGYCFSLLRPRGDVIKSLGSRSSGPMGFAPIFDAMCKAIASAGHRRGAQMLVLRVDHPDIEEFIDAKSNDNVLTAFNLSIGITNEFMEAVENDTLFELRFEGKVYKTVWARGLWDKIMRMTWDWAEPGVLFIDTINEMNNLYYCETISATNPCAEQPLPPFGACLLGSFNLTKYIYLKTTLMRGRGNWGFDWGTFKKDIPHVVRAMDNVIDRAVYPLPEQEAEAKSKRRMGLGPTGLANAAEALGYPYGSVAFLDFENQVLKLLTNECYRASALLAKEKGPFPLYDERYLDSKFVRTMLDEDVQQLIRLYGIRNSHLTSTAPTGTISLTADNISSGIEPVFAHMFDRTVQEFDGPRVERVEDYGVRVFGVKGRTANECSVDDHLNALLVASRWMDSAVSKTCNVGDNVTFEQFKEIYMTAWRGGAKGCTTFRAAGKRYGVLNEVKAEGEACFIDLETGKKTCE